MPALPSSLISSLSAAPAGICVPDSVVGLPEALASVPDPRARRGVRHWLTVVLTAAVCAVVAGCCSYTAIAEWVADLPEQTAGRLGIDARRRPSEADGSLLPCWSWASQPGLYSGKHQTTGLSVQVACTLAGNLAWVSDAINGARPDSFALHDSEALVLLDPGNWIGDKGYVGNGMLTPYKKPAGGELKEWQKECNSQINKVRWFIEQVIAHLKTWRILHTDYRRPLETFRETIACVIALHFYRMAAE